VKNSLRNQLLRLRNDCNSLRQSLALANSGSSPNTTGVHIELEDHAHSPFSEANLNNNNHHHTIKSEVESESAQREEYDHLKRLYFNSLAVGVKLSLSLSKRPKSVNIDIADLYEEARDVDIKKWNNWIFERMDNYK